MAVDEMFVQRLNNLVNESGYSQKQIAALCHTTEASLSRYINGARMPNPAILANLATALHTTTDYMLGKTENDYAEIKAIVARSKEFFSAEQKKELSDILLEINERLFGEDD
ncbi:MAG: helix-turn-helix transcriptional regulator [Treponema sp.]|jgi:transcriptional regulator with XRE-family HTH domain|nr:helix-turn-helix transcriptional regulator [Treponema sp.]